MHLGKYGRLRRNYLENGNEELLRELIIEGKLEEHLQEVDQAAQQMLENIIAQMLKNEPAPDKGLDQMEWVRHMTSLHATAEKIVLAELVYS